jgi:hypothetical protein
VCLCTSCVLGFGAYKNFVKPGKVLNDGTKVGYFENCEEETMYSPHRMTAEPQNCINFEHEHYNLSFKCFLYRNCKIAFLLRFSKLDNIVNYMPGLAL